MDDFQLINLVKNKDNEALSVLINRYIGIVHNVKNKFFLRGYDQDDWYQDGLIICYESCCKYDVERGSNFGSFFKTNLINHAYSLLRRELAQSREPYRRAVSYEHLLNDKGVEEDVVELQTAVEENKLECFVKSLSHIEVIVFLNHLGYLSEQDLRSVNYTKEQMQQAKHRCKRKFLQATS